ncbi:MAG: amino acid ABC transporter substrate-binding protein [Desulfosarcinaceae bacterium]|nr:amino acid ABC transporter substrate-binding protein [Desulfosarcinaceae bacterium]
MSYRDNRRRSTYGIRWLGVLLVCGLLLSAADLRAEAIRLGGTLSLSGVYREPSEMIRKAYQLWARHTNARGGLVGRPVELLIYDDQSNPERVQHYYRKLIEADGVDLLLSPYGSPLTMAAAAVSDARKYVMVACASAAEAVWRQGYTHLFGMYATSSRYFIGLLDLIARERYRSVAVIYEQSAFHQEVAESAEKWARRFRLDVPIYHGFPRGSGLAPIVDRLRSHQPPLDSVIVSAYPTDSYRLLEHFQKLNFRPGVLGMSIAPTYPDFYLRAGEIADAVFSPSQWEPDERIPFPGTRTFIQAFKEAYGHLPSYHAGSAYAACEILARAVSTVGGIDQRKLRDTISVLDTVTIIGRFKVDRHGMQIGHSPILIQWQAGRKQIVYPSKMQTALPRLQ